MQFEQATIKVQQAKEFAELRERIAGAFAAAHRKKFLRLLLRRGIRVRDLDAVFAKGVLDGMSQAARRVETAQALYQRLAVSDQAQIKEFYLFQVEEVAPQLRAKFHKLYQYY